MDSETAWEQFKKNRSTEKVQKTSVTGMLDTISAQLNDIKTDTERTAQIVPKVMGDEGAIDSASASLPPVGADAPTMGGEELGMEGIEDTPPADAPLEGELGAEGAGMEALPGEGVPEEESMIPPEEEAYEAPRPPGGDEVGAVAGAAGEEPDVTQEEPMAEVSEVPIADEPVAEVPGAEDMAPPEAGMEEEAPIGAEDALVEEVPGEEMPKEGMGDVIALYDNLMNAIKEIAYQAIDAGNTEAIANVAESMDAIEGIWGANMAPALDAMSGTDDFTKSYAERVKKMTEESFEKAECDETSHVAESDGPAMNEVLSAPGEEPVAGTCPCEQEIISQFNLPEGIDLDALNEALMARAMQHTAEDIPAGPPADATVEIAVVDEEPGESAEHEEEEHEEHESEEEEKEEDEEDFEKTSMVPVPFKDLYFGRKCNNLGVDGKPMKVQTTEPVMKVEPAAEAVAPMPDAGADVTPDVPGATESVAEDAGAGAGSEPVVKAQESSIPTKHIATFIEMMSVKKSLSFRPDASVTSNADIERPSLQKAEKASEDAKIKMGRGINAHEVVKNDWKEYNLYKTQKGF